MPGTKAGGLKAAKTNLEKYGEDFYARVGKLGGEKSRGGGFTKIPGLAAEAGRRGGRNGRKAPLAWHQRLARYFDV